MKILFTGYHNPHFVTITEHIERAIQLKEHTLLSFEDRNFLLPGRLRDRFSFLQTFELKRLNRALLQKVEQFKPDLVLVSGGHRVLPKTVQTLHDWKIKTALWTIDPPLDFEPVLKVAPFFDSIFCGGSEAVDILKERLSLEGLWVPFACNPEVHTLKTATPEEKKIYSHDIVFVGSYYPNRADIFESLTEFDIAIWGPGWPSLPETSPLKPFIKGGSLEPDEWTKVLRCAKIVLVIHYQDKARGILCHQASPKLYENLACGAFTLVDNQRDVESLFKNGEHLAIFKSIDDLKKLIPYYLKSDKLRSDIATKGRELVLNKHTFEHRVDTIVTEVNRS